MLTLSEINALTDTYAGDVYSDLYKDVYGFRPRNCTFVSVEAFDAEWEYLVNRLDEQQHQEKKQQEISRELFELRVNDTMELVRGIDRARAIEIIADAEGELDQMEWYGYESLEYHFGLGFGYIKSTMQGEVA
jgi:hypothetical protein